MAAKADLRTGEKQAGRFQKGKSGNPGGRPKKSKEVLEVERLALKHSPAAIKRLAEWMTSDNAKASVSACGIILDRGVGKVPQALTDRDGGSLAEAFIGALESARERVKHARG